MIKKNPSSRLLREYQDFYNLLEYDPEGIPPYDIEQMNRSQFSYAYLHEILKERRIFYRKANPKSIVEHYYFDQVLSSHKRESIIPSFSQLLETFQD